MLAIKKRNKVVQFNFLAQVTEKIFPNMANLMQKENWNFEHESGIRLTFRLPGTTTNVSEVQVLIFEVVNMIKSQLFHKSQKIQQGSNCNLMFCLLDSVC